MGKYKKYAKTEQNLDQQNKISSNNSNTNNLNQSNKMKNKKLDINNKNEIYKLSNGNYVKTDENSLREILCDIWDAMKYFFIMCKNFIIPSGISFKIFASFIILELLYQGIIIYIINCVLSILNQYFPIWNKSGNMYIYVISYIQMIYIFVCEGLLIFRFIHFKIFIFQKLNWLVNILTCIIIILNAISIKDLNSKIYRFNVKHSDISLFNIKILKDNVVNEYINLYINKDDDFEQYELCNELHINDIIFNKYKERVSMYNWYFDTNSNLYIACKNYSISFKQNDGLKNKQIFKLLNCQNNIDSSQAPDFCVSSKYRQKRFYYHLKIAFYEIIILMLWNLYNYFSIKFIQRCYPALKNNNKSNLYGQNNFSNLKNNYDKNNNKTVTYKDINDGKNEEIYDEDYSEEEEYENEEEEEENNIKNEEEHQKDNKNNIKEIKIRKINKKKWNKKKRKKNRYKEEKMKNKNKYFDEGILNKDFYEKNEDNNDDPSDKNDDDDNEEDYYQIKNNLDSSKENDGKEEDDNDENDEEEEEDEEEEDDDDEDTNNYINKKDKYEEIRKSYIKKIKKHQYLQKVYNYLIGNYINWIKYKIHQILLEIDKNLSDDDDE